MGTILLAAAPPPPDGAKPLRERGAFEQQTDICGLAITSVLHETMPHLTVDMLQVPEGTGWSDVRRHYAAALPGWRKLTMAQPPAPNCVLEGWTGPDGSFAVGMVTETFTGSAGKFKVVYVVTQAAG